MSMLLDESEPSITNEVRDIQVLKTYGAAPYAAGLRRLEKQIKEKQASVNEKIGVKVKRSASCGHANAY